MARPPEPVKRAALLERCFAAAIQGGTLELTLEHLALGAGTSARMLVYHFGSKEALDHALMTRLDAHLRERFDALVRGSAAGPALSATSLERAAALETIGLTMWDEFTAPDMLALLRLTAGLRHRAMRGDEEAAQAIAIETDAWRALLVSWDLDADQALAFVLLADGAVNDFLVTGDAGRGRRAIRLMLQWVSAASELEHEARVARADGARESPTTTSASSRRNTVRHRGRPPSR